jgi:hypothetical protein
MSLVVEAAEAASSEYRWVGSFVDGLRRTLMGTQTTRGILKLQGIAEALLWLTVEGHRANLAGGTILP